MTLAVFDIEYEGLRRRETTSGNPAVRESVIGLDAMLTNAGRALFGYLVEPEVDVRATDEVGCLEVDLGFNANYGMARRASLAGRAAVHRSAAGGRDGGSRSSRARSCRCLRGRAP